MWAHSANSGHQRHRLEDHLRGSAVLAREFAGPFGLGDLAGWAALVHDGGKAWCAWQTRLLRVEATGERVGIDHKSYGVHLARSHGLDPVEWAVAGHHGGLTRRDKVDELFVEDSHGDREQRWADSERVLRPLVPEIYSQVPTLSADFATGADRMTRDFALRFLFSCLVDADVLDTQAHHLRLGAPRRGRPLDASVLFQRFLKRREEYLRRRGTGERWMNQLRELVFEAALSAATAGPGVFRMTAPTGAAKTIAAAAFALRHAAEFGKRRVIVAVPFITITEQNAAVYRELLNDEDPAAEPVVLEHHSHLDLDNHGGSRSTWGRLAAENWDAPFVVTTTVQLLESLFGRMPSRMRKVHRLADSVIVLDEVQALPHRLLPQVADALRILTQRFGVSVLLSSATQPELGALRPLQDLPAREIVPDVPTVFAESCRVRYRWLPRSQLEPRPTMAEVVTQALTHPRVLMVVNTVRDARTVFEQARDQAGPGVWVAHLSTGMCAAHRHAVLTEVKDRLKAETSLFLVSTSLIEAGVDVDFPMAFRAMAPPDSLAQVAGRCNREGRLGRDGGLVVIFDPVDGGAPPSYQTQIDLARTYVGPDRADPDNPEKLQAYFEHLYRTLDVEGPASAAQAIKRHRWYWDFVGVTDGPLQANGKRDRAKAFRLILDDTVPVVVPYGTHTERAMVSQVLATLRGPEPDPGAWRRIQPYLTTVRRRTMHNQPEVAALTLPVVGDLLEWRGTYDDGFGLDLQPRGEDYIL